MLRVGLHTALHYLPVRQSVTIASRLVRRGNAARDAGQFRLAASLYEEALRITPHRPRLHVQCGHMFKEAGELGAAERHYFLAQELLPSDPDLALQLGHFYKIAFRPEEAEAAYRRALELRPGWAEAAEEVARLQRPDISDDVSSDYRWIVPELLPRPVAGTPLAFPDRLQILRMAPRRMRGEIGMVRALTGVEAIRGFCISADPLTDVAILLDSREIIRQPLQSNELEVNTAKRKFVFNVWYDFSAVDPGDYRIEVRVLASGRKVRSSSDHVTVVAPGTLPEPDGSDAFIPLPHLPEERAEDLADRVNALPSMVRSAARSVLPSPVRSILVARADQLGDLICSLPALRRLRSLFPDARITGILTSANADLARSLGLFDEVVVAAFAESPQQRRRTLSVNAQRALREALGTQVFDLAIDLCEVSDSRPLLLLANARFRYGFKERESPWLSAGFDAIARDPVNGLESSPPSRKILALIETLGAMHSGSAEVVRRPELDRSALLQLGIGLTDRFVVLHTGARLPYTRWPGFNALVDALLEKTDLVIVLLTGLEGDAPERAGHPRLRVLTGNLPFDLFETLLQNCAAFVGNDSGAKHLAALRGAKVVSLHMARLNWSEWGQELAGTIISRRVPCAGCAIGHDAEDCGKGFACLTNIEPEEVLKAVQALL